MLVLTRSRGEDVLIQFGGRQVTVRFCGLRDGRIRLGFIAPRDIRIRRAECPPREHIPLPAPLPTLPASE
ncbi:MAG: carbon storage regulator [Planctomycetes bacterium]|nr:carbon storage regulator [Planctomycetota bacterium]